MFNILSKTIIGLTAISLIVSACGSGGGGSAAVSPPAMGTAEGLWNGTTGTNRAVSGLVLDDGNFWFMYSAEGNSAVIAGVVQGTGTSSDLHFTSSNGVDFNLEGLGVNDFSFSGTYTQKSQIGGVLTYAGGSTNSLSGTYSTDYDLTPSLSTVAGTYSGTAATAGGVEAATVTISGAGAISGMSAGGCHFTGTASVRTKGNVYNIAVMFGGGVCSNGTNTVNGVAYYDATSSSIVSAALNSGRSNGFLFEGAKP
jgi:hypothetical protein